MLDLAYITLAGVPGIGRVRLDALLRAFGDAETVLTRPHRDLVSVSGMSRAAASAVTRADASYAEHLIARVEALGAEILVPNDARFPDALRHIPDAPTLLFIKGNVRFLESPAVAVVGSRDHSAYGAEVCRMLATACASAGLTVVSGLARGLDAVAHTAALDVGGGTVGILGNGLGVVYPAANRTLYERVVECGCLLTEFPPGERPHAGSFPRRNRLISGLARVTLVVEARRGSGALITADCALNQGKDVLAVPGPVNSPLSEGTNRLIQLGAKPVLETEDILEEFGLTETGTQLSLPADISDAERRVIDLLQSGPVHVDHLAGSSALPLNQLLPALTSLEIRGLVAQDVGMTFRRTR